MRRDFRWLIGVAALLAATWVTAEPPFTLQPLTDLPLSGRASRFDYQSIDPERHRLYIAHMGDGAVLVVDLAAQRLVATVPDMDDVHGVLAIPTMDKVYASVTGRKQVAAINADTLAVTASIPAGKYPDGMAYAPNAHKLYVSDESGSAETVIDTRADRRIATIELGGEAGNTQFDPVSGHIFVNVQTRNELVEIDPAHDHIVARHPLSGAKHNHGLLIEPSRRLAFIACEGNAKLLVLDMNTMQVLSTHSVGKTPDVLAFDADLSLLYVASESSVLTVFHLDGNTLQKRWEQHIDGGAHTIAVDDATHRVYLPLAVSGKPVLRVMQPVIADL